jgi:hypothetical protein
MMAYPLTVCSHLKTFWCAPHVHRPDKREQECHPAKRIHHRLSWGHKHRIDVVDQHGQERQKLDHIQGGRTELAGCLKG